MGCAPVTADTLRARAQNAVGLSMQLTPALPVAWPAVREGVMFLAYPSEILPTENQRTRLRSPTHRIVFAPGNGEPRIERLDSGRVLGTQDDTAEPIAAALVGRAEQAIVDIVSGCRTVDQAATELGPYLQWLDEQPIIAQDLGGRIGGFIAWLRTVRR